jgi:spermidine/putrescine transport system substrate-binding protein
MLRNLACAAAALLALGLPLAAQPSSPAGEPAREPAGTLRLHSWPNYTPPELLRKFQEETGIEVALSVYESNEALLAELQAGGAAYDVVVPSDYMARILIEQGLAQRIDVGAMENAANLKPPFASPAFDPSRTYSAPYLWGTTGFTYDREAVGGTPLEESWGALFAPRDTLKGRIAMLDDEVELYNAAAYYAGLPACTEEPTEAERILEILQAQKPHVATYSSLRTIDRLVDGEVAAHMQWNGAAHRTGQRLPSAVYVYPREGLTYWADNLVVPTGARNVENARRFINWMMAPQNAALTSNFTGYMNAVKGSEAHLDEALRNDPAVNMPDAYAERLRPHEDCSARARELRSEVWTRLRR